MRDSPFLCGNGGLADLLLARKHGGEEGLAAAARLLGYGPSAPQSRSDAPPAPSTARAGSGAEAGGQGTELTEITLAPLAETPFWRLTERTVLAPLEPPPSERFTGSDTRPDKLPPVRELCRWSALLPTLRTGFTERVEGRAPDEDRLVREIDRGRPLRRIPRRRHRRWGRGIQIIVDRSERLIPFQEDQDRTADHLAALFPRHAVEFALAFDGSVEPVLLGPHGEYRPYRPPEPGWLVAVLGDLGSLAGHAAPVAGRWEALGRRLAAAGCRLVALAPCPPSRWRREDLRSWTMLPWEGRRGGAVLSRSELAERAERLLRLLSPAIRIEPGLLRDLRLLLGADADAGTEADAWSHRAMAGHSRVAGVFNPDEARRLRDDLAVREEPDMITAVFARIQRWRAGLAPEVWYEELVNLPSHRVADLPPAIRDHDLPAARQYFKDLAQDVEQREGGGAWCWRSSMRASSHLLDQADPAFKAALQQIHQAGVRYGGDLPLPPGFDPALIPSNLLPMSVDLRQRACRVHAGGDSSGSLLAGIETRNGLVHVFAMEESAAGDAAFWKSGAPPHWAKDWGWDDHGAWVTFSIDETTTMGKPVIQKMRWIPPGRFKMGSPEDEHDRFSDESPQHEVTFEQGFWLFDTACTQALWQAVMGDNPSRFKKHPDHPVAMVSFEDVQVFLRKINAALPGLDLTLPSEAQWEYACRAGTSTPFSFGEEITPNQVNYDGHFPYRDGPKGEYRGRTVPVASLPANPWGLYEMHGNVWEWCADAWHHTYAGAPTDGNAWDGPAADRVMRGGSWSLHARFVRAACRAMHDPEDRNASLGFRCARVQVSPADQAGQQGAEPAEPSPSWQAERQGAMAPSGGASLLRLREEPNNLFCEIPKAPAFHILSDCERLIFRRMTRPDWAEAMGRDGHGLWARIAVPGPGSQPVTQRLRWIPPGRFWMGSPEDGRDRVDERESPQHEVTFKQGFWLFDTACTQALWRAVMGYNPSQFQSPDRPVEGVSFTDAQQFLKRINEEHPGLDLTLPSEAQWEYACRAGTSTPFSFGENITPDQVNYNGHLPYRDGPTGEYRGRTVPVASLPANPWGLYEMHGNVWEWCADVWHDDYAGAPTDGSVWDGPAADRVMRGGSWDFHARNVRAACRLRYNPGLGSASLGFRCARAYDRMDFRT